MNEQGDVIGIATLFIREGQNLNFAIPVSKLVSLLNKVSNARPLVPHARLAFDGLYWASFRTVVCEPPQPGCDGAEVIEWFRFHADGLVFRTSTKPNEISLDKIFGRLAHSGRAPYTGKYVIKGSRIEFVLYGGTYRDSSFLVA